MSHRAIVPIILLCSALATPVAAGTVSLAWDPVEHPELAGYRVYYSTVPDSFADSVDVGPVTEATLSGLADCTTHYVCVKARDDAGNESADFSNTVSGWARPVLTAASPSEIQRNTEASLTLEGVNFQAGATVVFDDPAIVVDQATWNGCHELVVQVSVGPDAQLGPGSLRVVNPDTVFGEAAGLFAVVTDGTAPVITETQATAVAATTATITWATDEPADSLVRFRKQGETGYHESPVDPAAVTDHAVTLQGLMPETTYEFHVESRDDAGNASSSSDQMFTTQASSYAYLRLEAESGTPGSPIEDGAGDGAFLGQWIQLPTGAPSGTESDPTGTAEFGFYVPHAASWQVWIRVSGSDPSGGTWFEEVDDAGMQSVLASQQGAWEWVAARSYALDEGSHQLRLGGMQPGAMADRVLITDDPGFVPTEEPDDDVVAPDPVDLLVAVQGDGMNSLSWANPFDDDDTLTLVIRYRLDGGFPTSPVDGLPAVEAQVEPGSSSGFDHTGLTNGTTYYYSVFAIDESGNASDPVTVEATPEVIPPDNVENLTRTDTE